MATDTLQLFKNLLPPEQISTDPGDLEHYGRDWLKEFTPHAGVVLFPKTTEQVAQVVTLCNDHQISLVPSGGRTGLSGGATATKGEVILSLERMNQLVEFDTVGRTITVQAGMPTAKVQQLAAEHHLFFPLEFSSKGSSQIGGNIATNAGGIRVVKYGPTREWVVGLKAVTGKGEIISCNGKLIKNQTGYDLRSLLVGSEGTLAIITEATLLLTNPPAGRERILCALSSLNTVLPIFNALRAQFSELSVFELFPENGLAKVLEHHKNLSRPFATPSPWYVLVEIEQNRSAISDETEQALATLFEQGLITDGVIAQGEAQGANLLELRERIGEVLSTSYCPHKNDISVAVAAVPEFTARLEALTKSNYPEYEVVIFGHVGDGNLHVNVLKPAALTKEQFFTKCHELDEKLFALVREFSGSISAEHGVGLLKRDFLHYSRSEAEIALMRGIKRAFDPLGILNPGKIFV